MNRFRALYAIIKVGYLNKIRTYRFLIILGLVIVAGLLFVPTYDAGYVTLGWGSDTTFYRGIYNSAWIGSMVAMLTGIFLTLMGFFVVKDNVTRDEKTGVGQIIATTPLRNSDYVLGNTLSNFAILSSMVAVISVTSIGVQLVRGEVLTIDLFVLMAPFLVFVLPLMFLVGAIAVLFETKSSLRGGLGNIVFVFGWLFSLPILSDSFDLFGIKAILSSMRTSGVAEYPDLLQNQSILGLGWGFPEGRSLETFTWPGIEWTFDILQSRMLLLGLAIGICIIASFLFNRFDPALESQRMQEITPLTPPEDEEIRKSDVVPLKEIRIRPLSSNAYRFSFRQMLYAEWNLVLKDLQDFPMMGSGALGIIGVLIIAGVILPINTALGIILPFAWFLPVLIWSKMGTREVTHQTEQLIFSSTKSLKHQFPASWLAGVFLSMLTGSGVALNLLFNANWFGIIAWLVGALFIPSLALCLGIWTSSRKVFEFIYAMLWYIGPINRAELLDFMGVVSGSVEAGIWQFYLVLTIILIGLASIGRKWQIQKG